jgi:hypothetical protein
LDQRFGETDEPIHRAAELLKNAPPFLVKRGAMLSLQFATPFELVWQSDLNT